MGLHDIQLLKLLQIVLSLGSYFTWRMFLSTGIAAECIIFDDVTCSKAPSEMNLENFLPG